MPALWRIFLLVFFRKTLAEEEPNGWPLDPSVEIRK